MKFFAVTLAALAATVSAGAYGDYETCEVVTVTSTVTEGYPVHTPSAPGYPQSSGEVPYPTTAPGYPGVTPPEGTGYPVPPPQGTGYPVPPPQGTGYPVPPHGTGYPVPPPQGTGYPVPPPAGSGYPVPSGTGGYTAPPPEFTGAASGLKVGGALAGVGAIAALFL